MKISDIYNNSKFLKIWKKKKEGVDEFEKCKIF